LGANGKPPLQVKTLPSGLTNLGHDDLATDQVTKRVSRGGRRAGSVRARSIEEDTYL
jgi:hypothetical protein